MKKNRIFEIIISVLLLVAICCFTHFYFTSLTKELGYYSARDRGILVTYNEEIVKKFQDCENISQWQKIIDSYDEIIIHVENSDGKTVAKTADREWSVIDTKVQQAFMFSGEAYMIRISVYLLRDYLTDSGYLFRMLLIVFLTILVFIFAIIILIYAIMIRPLHKLYSNIENYEKGEAVVRSRKHSEIARLQNRFVDMTETISKQQQNQRRIIASISHDIKTPLTSIMGYAELLKKSNLSPERQERYLNTVYNKAATIKDLIDDFDEYLDYNMETSLKKQRMSVITAMDKLTENYEDELGGYAVEYIYKPNDITGFTEIDVQKMQRVIGNIIGNSLKHFKHSKKTIEVECTDNSKEIIITVSDNGEGVEPEKLELIFEPLYTSDEGRKVAGLGLAICKEIVEAHGGEIYAEESKYGGLAVIIKLKKCS